MKNANEILHGIISEAVNELLTVIAEDFKKMSFSDIVRTTKDAVNKLGVQLIERIVALTDERYNAMRDKRAVILRHTKTRKMVSEMGELALTRKLYYDKQANRYFFAVDELLNIEKYSRIDGELKTKLITDATQSSYGKASTLSGGLVSRQTVLNILKRIPTKSLIPQANGFKKIDELYIEADEDHIHLNSGRSAEVKLIYVHEGRRAVNNGRTELVNAKYFATAGSGTKLWDAVADYVYYQYDVSTKSIRISGDGAAWIKQGLNVFPLAVYRLDKFHVYKCVTDASCGNAAFRKKVIDCIKGEDRDGVLRLFSRRCTGERELPARSRLADDLVYLDNNFDEIDLTAKYTCSAEGHVSHVLSERMSSRPMGWSVAGADKMARLRAFYYNGGNFSELVNCRTESTEENHRKYNKYAVRNRAVNSGGDCPKGRVVLSDEISEEVSNAIKKILQSGF